MSTILARLETLETLLGISANGTASSNGTPTAVVQRTTEPKTLLWMRDPVKFARSRRKFKATMRLRKLEQQRAERQGGTTLTPVA